MVAFQVYRVKIVRERIKCIEKALSVTDQPDLSDIEDMIDAGYSFEEVLADLDPRFLEELLKCYQELGG